jgi:hypothetical protein
MKFDMDKGFVRGEHGGAPVDLKYDKISGSLQGRLDGEPASMKMTNLDLYDFLTHFYAFAK